MTAASVIPPNRVTYERMEDGTGAGGVGDAFPGIWPSFASVLIGLVASMGLLVRAWIRRRSVLQWDHGGNWLLNFSWCFSTRRDPRHVADGNLGSQVVRARHHRKGPCCRLIFRPAASTWPPATSQFRTEAVSSPNKRRKSGRCGIGCVAGASKSLHGNDPTEVPRRGDASVVRSRFRPAPGPQSQTLSAIAPGPTALGLER